MQWLQRTLLDGQIKCIPEFFLMCSNDQKIKCNRIQFFFRIGMCTSVLCFYTAASQNAEAAHGLLYTACLTDFNHLFYEWSDHLHTKRVSTLADICVSSLGLGVALHKTRCHQRIIWQCWARCWWLLEFVHDKYLDILERETRN